MMSDLLTRLTTAVRGSPGLSAEVLTVLLDRPVRVLDSRIVVPAHKRPLTDGRVQYLKGDGYRLSITESLDAVWEMLRADNVGFALSIDHVDGDVGVSLEIRGAEYRQTAHTTPLALCAAMVAAKNLLPLADEVRRAVMALNAAIDAARGR